MSNTLLLIDLCEVFTAGLLNTACGNLDSGSGPSPPHGPHKSELGDIQSSSGPRPESRPGKLVFLGTVEEEEEERKAEGKIGRIQSSVIYYFLDSGTNKQSLGFSRVAWQSAVLLVQQVPLALRGT